MSKSMSKTSKVKKTVSKVKKPSLKTKAKVAPKKVRKAITIAAKSKPEIVVKTTSQDTKKCMNYCKYTTFFSGVFVGALLMWLLVAVVQTDYGKTSTFFRFFSVKSTSTQLNTSNKFTTQPTLEQVNIYTKPGINGD